MIENILVTGGTGKTGRRVVERLRTQGLKPRVASRSPQGADTVRFEWKDASTFEAAFRDVQAVYLVAPTDDFDTIGAMQRGLEAALKAGVRRFVLLSASSIEEGGPMMGAVHAWLRANAPEWIVLRPSWFMQNFTEGQHLDSIRNEASIYTATQDARIGFIDAENIANCAAKLLSAPEVESTDYILTGPEAVSYDEVAVTLSRHLDRTVSHQRLTQEGIAKRFRDLGVPDDYAETLAAMDATIATGTEDRVTKNVQSITGQPPTSIEAFVQRNVSIWKS